LIDIYHTHRRG